MTEQELVRAAAARDTEAFAALVRLYENKVYHLTLRLCGNEEDAQDAAQEAFLSAWRGLPSFREEAEFATWLYRLASNAAIDCLRRGKRQRGNLSLDDEELAEGAELRSEVARGLDKLRPDHRQILVLRELGHLSYEEIAGRLELDLGTVKSRISRARGALRKILLENGNLSGYLPSKGVKKADGEEGR